MTVLLLLFITTVMSQLTWPSHAALPDKFVDEEAARVEAVVGGTFATFANGTSMLLINTKRTEVYRVLDYEGIDSPTRRVLDLNGCDDGERGIQTVVPHPDFAVNKFLYIFYAARINGGCGTRINYLSRFVYLEDEDRIDEESEELLLQSPANSNTNHNGGGMAFGNDGYLYLTLGDGGDGGRLISIWNHTLFGKVLRLTDTGEIPADNPYADVGARCHQSGDSGDTSVPCAEIFAVGLRNPFRLAMDVNSPKNITQFYIQDVGSNSFEEVNRGGYGYELANYGWPIREGPCRKSSYRTECHEEGYTEAMYFGNHGRNKNENSCFVGGAVVPNGLWPLEDDSYIFLDHIRDLLMIMSPSDYDPANECRDCNPPTSAYKPRVFHPAGRPTDAFFGPYGETQALYYLARRGTFSVRRIRFTGTINKSPTAVITTKSGSPVNPEGNSVPLTLELDGSLSTDPNVNDTLTYEWDFGLASGVTAEGAAVTITYPNKGLYNIKLTVTDQGGLQDVALMEVIVGQRPTATILAPAEGATFGVRDTFPLIGSAIDSDGNEINSDNLVWEMRQHHADHWHPFLVPTNGNYIQSWPAPPPEDFLASTNSYLEVRLMATDANGVPSLLASRNVMPRGVFLQFQSIPSGLSLNVDSFRVQTPITVLTWENHNLTMEIAETPDGYGFMYWSDGGAASHSIIVPPAADSSGNTGPEPVITKRFTAVFFPKLIQDVCSASDGLYCDACHGGCVTDDDCVGDLLCYTALPNEPVILGCFGSISTLRQAGVSSSWCVDVEEPSSSPSMEPTPSPTAFRTPQPTSPPTSPPAPPIGGVLPLPPSTPLDTPSSSMSNVATGVNTVAVLTSLVIALFVVR